MKITRIVQQAKRKDRYSVYIDDVYGFSLSETALLESKLASGGEITRQQVEQFKQLSADDKLTQQAIRYAAHRPRSLWEIEQYLQRKHASPALSRIILNKLTIMRLVDDFQLAKALVHDRILLRPASRRKIIYDLRRKNIAEETIQAVVGEAIESDAAAIQAVIERKRRQVKYQDNNALMRYLARQGFSYDDIKSALSMS